MSLRWVLATRLAKGAAASRHVGVAELDERAATTSITSSRGAKGTPAVRRQAVGSQSLPGTLLPISLTKSLRSRRAASPWGSSPAPRR